ncbi:MAG: hypothetical protein GHCLOJNM_01774 [bacterium]|nr:hypothetical protein [bacterium]
MRNVHPKSIGTNAKIEQPFLLVAAVPIRTRYSLAGINVQGSGYPRGRINTTTRTGVGVNLDRSILFQNHEDWLKGALGCIDGFTGLRKGWNSYSALPPNRRAVSLTREFILIAHQLGMRPTRISPGAFGGVAVFFEAGVREVYVALTNRGEVSALFTDEARPEEAETVKYPPGMTGFRKLLRAAGAHLG